MDEASPQGLELRSQSPADATEPLPTAEENGEADLVGNGAAPGPEMDVSDGGAEPGEGRCRAPPPYIFQGGGSLLLHLQKPHSDQCDGQSCSFIYNTVQPSAAM